MFYNTQQAPASVARQIGHHIDLIANAFECSHAWLNQMARLVSTGKAIHALPFADNKAAIAAVDTLCTQVRP
ncbi:hypothetical protein [Xanthomonas arboricola]|uniref:hypothetical protein n=1 Tax=Xanthomonas arboricola TaxID=56448 RepID=UPI001616C85A|nr:hypothetical protein [Xanthomonas arboricola]MBB5861925.1 hypothetical protein [Xanthomonas arboricola]CAD7386033.1 hypothetical protein X12_003805 [Xanthomonas arboricola]CAG2096693.1 hypothetical protein XCY_003808 [Xanthomonas arboricola pv. juglandis]